MSLFYGILLAAFLLFDIVVVAVCIAYASNRREKRIADGKLRPTAASASLGLAMAIKFAIVWSAAVLFFDYFFYLRDAVKQWHTLGFASVPGEILRCDVIATKDSDGTARNFDVEYSYCVHDREYRATVVRHLNHWSEDSMATFVADHAPHTPVSVFYDPDNPADAVLLPGIGGTELFVPLILFPFNLVMLGFWWAGLAYALGGKRSLTSRLTGVRFFDSSVRIPPQAPVVGASVAVAVVILPAILGVCFVAGVPASIPAALSAWGFVLGSAAVVYLYLAMRAASGRFDLVVDRLKNTLTLPYSTERDAPLVVRLADLTGIEVASETDDEKHTRYVPTVHWRDTAGDAHAVKLAAWPDQELAGELVAWLRRRTQW